MRAATITLYSIDELTGASRQKALEEHRTINVEYAWWDVAHLGFTQELEALGLTGKNFYWDLYDRSFHCADLAVGDLDRFLRTLGYQDLRQRDPRMLRAAWQNGDLCLRTERLSHRCYRNRLKVFTGRRDLDEAAETRAGALLRDFGHSCLRQLDLEYEFMTSDQAAAETLLANGAEFTRLGQIWSAQAEAEGEDHLLRPSQRPLPLGNDRESSPP